MVYWYGSSGAKTLRMYVPMQILIIQSQNSLMVSSAHCLYFVFLLIFCEPGAMYNSGQSCCSVEVHALRTNSILSTTSADPSHSAYTSTPQSTTPSYPASWILSRSIPSSDSLRFKYIYFHLWRQKYTLGDPTQPSTTLGPVVSLASADRIRKQVTDASASSTPNLHPPKATLI